MTINFVTTNKHKVEEARLALLPFNIQVVQLDINYDENHDESLDSIVRNAATKLAVEYKKPVLVEDTGLFFKAWPGFPGALPKFVWQTLGYKGIFKLLEGTTREAYFKTVIGYSQPSKTPKLFSAVMRGNISEKIHNPKQEVMPYDRIFIPVGERVTISDMTLEQKNTFSQRGKVFRKLGKWLVKVN